MLLYLGSNGEAHLSRVDQTTPCLPGVASVCVMLSSPVLDEKSELRGNSRSWPISEVSGLGANLVKCMGSLSLG